jgi:hypothetical protein
VLGGSAEAPSWVPAYPGSHPTPTFSASGESDEGAGEAGNFTFTTSDPPSRVQSFYEDEARKLGLDVELKDKGADTRVVVAKNHDEGRHLTVIIADHGASTTVNVTYARKR